MDKKHEEFINFLENVLFEAGADLEGAMMASGPLPSHINQDVHMAAALAAARTSQDILRIISREYKRIHSLPGADAKCCESCEQRIKRWQTLGWGTGEFLYDKRSPAAQVKDPLP